MAFKIGIGLTVLLALFLGYVSSRSGAFRYERSTLMRASADKIYPYISSFKMGSEWSPYERKDPNLKRNIIGSDGQPGTIMEFDGNREAGSGKLEFLKLLPNEWVQLRLTMTAPIKAENIVDYKLTPEGDGTRFSWAMSGDGGFMGKLMSTLIDCEKLVSGDMEKGLENLKVMVEKQP